MATNAGPPITAVQGGYFHVETHHAAGRDCNTLRGGATRQVAPAVAGLKKSPGRSSAQ